MRAGRYNLLALLLLWITIAWSNFVTTVLALARKHSVAHTYGRTSCRRLIATIILLLGLQRSSSSKCGNSSSFGMDLRYCRSCRKRLIITDRSPSFLSRAHTSQYQPTSLINNPIVLCPTRWWSSRPMTMTMEIAGGTGGSGRSKIFVPQRLLRIESLGWVHHQ